MASAINGNVHALAVHQVRLALGLDLTRAVGAHLTRILELAREVAEHRRLALEATLPDLRDAHLEIAAAYSREIEAQRRAQSRALDRAEGRPGAQIIPFPPQARIAA